MKWKTAIVGFGQVAAGYSDDPLHSRWYTHPTHAAALSGHPAFELIAVADLSERARANARERWQVATVAADVAELRDLGIEVAVLATPPADRLAAIDALPHLRAVLVEKPLAASVEEGRRFLDECNRRGILVAVNLVRRYDEDLQRLASGGLLERCGTVRAVFAVYGNGLRNNGSHIIDTARMLFGPIADLGVVPGATPFQEGPIEGDVNVAFYLVAESGLLIVGQPVRFADYREVSLDIWGERARLQLVLEGLLEIVSPRGDNRQLQHAREIAHDQSSDRVTSIGGALRRVYDNLDDALHGRAKPACSGQDAFETLQVVERLMDAARAR